MAEIASIEDRYLYSLSQLATVFNIARETVSKRLQQAGVIPSSERRGHVVYHIAAASRAIIEGDNPLRYSGIDDPDNLPPKDRLDFYRSENEKAKMLRENGQLLPHEHHEQVLGDILKIQLRALDTLEDMLERERVDHDVLVKVSHAVDQVKNDLADRLEEYEFERTNSGQE